MDQLQSDGNILHESCSAIDDVSPRTSVINANNNCSPGLETNPRVSVSSDVNNMGVRYSNKRALISVAILCFVNLINYMDRYTLAGNILCKILYIPVL